MMFNTIFPLVNQDYDCLLLNVPIENISLDIVTSPLPAKGLSSGFTTFEQGGLFIVPYVL